MISTRLQGGIGNMLFIIAFIESLGKKYNKEVGYLNTMEHLRTISLMPRSPYAMEYLTAFKNLNLLKPEKGIHTQMHWSDTFRELVPEEGVRYTGYFCSVKNFYSQEFIWDLFEPSDQVKFYMLKYADIFKNETCSVHIRRTDYVNNPGWVQLTKENYYNKAMRMIGNKTFLIFSDDIKWCKENFTGDQFVFIKDKDYIELFLMSLCDYNITANSTFSGWGAILNRNAKKIITPKEWVSDGRATTDEIVSESWIRV